MSRRRVVSFGTIVIAICGIVYYLATGNIGKQIPLGRDEAVVLSVYDGDTIKVRYQNRVESVRLIGIDAPEVDQQEWGRKARDRLYSITPAGSVVILEFDVTRRDKYNRLLAYVFTKDGIFVNEIMLKEGFALLYTFPPNVRYTERFREAQSYARENSVGIWGKDGLTMRPQDYRKNKNK